MSTDKTGPICRAPTVLFLTPSAYPFGGVADWLEYLLPGLNARGFRCVLGLMAGRHHLTGPYLDRHPWHDVEKISNPTGSPEGRITAIRQAIRRMQPDIVMSTNVAPTYEAVRRLRIEGNSVSRLVMTLHGLQSDLLADIASERDVLDAVVVTNKLSQRLATEALCSHSRVFYAAYGVPQRDAIAERSSLAPDGVRLLFCGRLEESQKRVSDLPVLIKGLRDSGLSATLSIAGGGPDEQALRDQCRLLGQENAITFLGVLSPEELSLEYRKHDALIITSSWETGPIVAWEAMSHGLPVVSSRYVGSGLENALDDGSNSLMFPVGDMDSAVAAVTRLLSPGLHARLVTGGLDLVRTRYSQEQSIAQWAQAIRSIMELPLLNKHSASPRSIAGGRLDRVLGVATAERVRRGLGLAYPHSEAGGEWPHTSHPSVDEVAWMSNAGELDQQHPGNPTA